MSARKIIALCIFLQVFQLSSGSISYMKHSKLKAINWDLPLAGHKLFATPIATSMVTNRMQCIAECGKTEGCVAINLGPEQAGENECELLDTGRFSLSMPMVNFTAQVGWTFVGPKTKCNADPCPTEKLCIANDPHEVDQYICFDITKMAICKDYSDIGFRTSGVYTLWRDGQSVPTYCDQEDDGGGWIVFMRNTGVGSEIFDTGWSSYQHGFGNLSWNFWWGNEKLHQVTKNTPHILKVDLKKSSGSTGYVTYTDFQISDKDDGYRLSFDISSYSGDGGPSLNHHNGKRFSTPDRDLDTAPVHCAKERKCGWWFGYCAYVTPTILWVHWGNWSPDLIDIKIRPM